MRLGYKNAVVMQSTEASTDLPLTKRALYRAVFDGALSEQLEIDPATVDLKRDTNPEFLPKPDEGVAHEEDAVFDLKKPVMDNIFQVKDALAKREGLVYDALIYNVGAVLWFSRRADSLDAGINQARDVTIQVY